MNNQPISIHKDGKWYFGEVEMFRRQILNVLAKNIVRNHEDEYAIQMGEDTNPLTVEDVPFYATGIYEKQGQTILVFHDLQEMVLDHDLKLYLRGDIPYISFRWQADTRLSRGIYWKLSEYFDFRGEEIWIKMTQVQ